MQERELLPLVLNWWINQRYVSIVWFHDTMWPCSFRLVSVVVVLRLSVIGSITVMIIAFYAVFNIDSVPFSLALVLMCGVVLGLTSAIIPNMIEQSVEQSVMGRVMNLYSMLLVLGPAIGTVLFKPGAKNLGIEPVVLVYAIVITVLLLALVLIPKPFVKNA